MSTFEKMKELNETIMEQFELIEATWNNRWEGLDNQFDKLDTMKEFQTEIETLISGGFISEEAYALFLLLNNLGEFHTTVNVASQDWEATGNGKKPKKPKSSSCEVSAFDESDDEENSEDEDEDDSWDDESLSALLKGGNLIIVKNKLD